MGWWETTAGVMSDGAADRVAAALDGLARPELTLASFRSAASAALDALPDAALDDPHRRPGLARSEGLDPRLVSDLERLFGELSALWSGAVGRPPRVAELVDALLFALRERRARVLPNDPTAVIDADLFAAPRSLGAALVDAASGAVATDGLWIDGVAMEGLAAVPGLVDLDVAPGTVAPEAWPMLARAPRLRRLRIEGGEVPAAAIGRLAQLESLSLAFSELPEDIVDQLRSLRSLRSLDLSGTALTDDAASALDLPLLEELRARVTALGDRTALALMTSPLVHASFARSALTDVGLAALVRIATLRHLEIEHSLVSAVGLTIIPDHPMLEALSADLAGAPADLVRGLGGAPALTSLVAWGAGAEQLAALNTCRTLTRLALPDVPLTADRVEALGALGSLRVLDLGGSPNGDAELTFLRGLGHVTEVVLSGTPISDAGLVTLAGCASLRRVDVRSCDLGEPALAALLAARADLVVRA